MKVSTYLQEAVESDINYELLGQWRIDGIADYSYDKKLFPYQIKAVQNAVCVLNEYYANEQKGRENLLNMCHGAGLPPYSLDVCRHIGKKENPQFFRLSSYFNPIVRNGEERIDEVNFFNRMCFWMATASGKTVVMIKLIEVLDTLCRKKLIPQKDILALFPNEKIQNQFNSAVAEYNAGKSRKIRIESLKRYDKVKSSFTADALNEITLFEYRSDLLSDEEKSRKIDTASYDNGGGWYVFMDEAHKGDKEDSLRQAYVTVLARNGFTFNFSATFTDAVDFATTCYNFNLEKFIESGYGKNVYLSRSKYSFVKNGDDLSQTDKRLQVLKSLLTFTLIKKAKPNGYYHNPLMVTLVNEVNTENSDTDMFFHELAEIASGKTPQALFRRAQTELYDEFTANKAFQFGKEELLLSDGRIKTALLNLTVSDVLKAAFNAESYGQIEIAEGEKGKEFALKLTTSQTPFALFRIGDAAAYIKTKLYGDYRIVNSYEEKHYFDGLNGEDGKNFNILIGSRMFYEGWDSNRPNVMNFINIGTGDAKKFVLQSLGRGVRIQPDPCDAKNRKRLKAADSRKEQLLETLFVFATNRSAVETILDTMDSQRADEKVLCLKKYPQPFPLLIPEFADERQTQKPALFNISSEAYEKYKKYVNSLSDGLLLLNFNVDKAEIPVIRKSAADFGSLFKLNPNCNYTDIKELLNKVTAHLKVYDKRVDGIKELQDEIAHFKHVKISDEQWRLYGKQIQDFINAPFSGGTDNAHELLQKALDSGLEQSELIAKIAEISMLTDSSPQIDAGNFTLKKSARHYYVPIITLSDDKADYAKHVINVPSEVAFLKNLFGYIKGRKFGFEWAFAKIDQTADDSGIAMPYYSAKDNSFHLFYPDFIFWLQKGSEYKIIFVDPKGMEYTDYMHKIDYYNRLFNENNSPKRFNYGGVNVTFDLKLIHEAKDRPPENYETYWAENTDFSWLTI